MNPDVVITGAGITGLAAAYELARRNVPCLVLEASGRAGGLILTDRVEGFTIEAGPDSMLAEKPSAIELCEELGLGPRLIATRPPRTAYVWARGRLHALPSPSVLGIPTTWSGIARYDLLTWPARARLAAEPLMPRASRTLDDESVASFFRRRFGRATVGLVAQPLLGGIHAGDIEALSIRSLFPRLVRAEASHGSVLRAFRPRHRGTSGGLFRSLVSGMGELVLALERRLPEGTLSVGTPVSTIARERDRWRVSWAGGAVDARAVILTTPAYVTSRLLAPLDRSAAAMCGEVPYVSTASVALVWPRASVTHPLSGSGFVVARQHSTLRITACTWVSSKWEGRAPADHVLLRIFVGGASDPEAAGLDDEALVGIATRDLSTVLGISGPPALARVYRWLNAGAQHNVGQLARTARIEQRLDALPGLWIAGSGFRSIGIPDCVSDGRAAAVMAAEYVKAR